jgi:PKD repeat protein
MLTAMFIGCTGNGDDKKPNKPPETELGPDFEVLSMSEVQFSSDNSSDPDGEIESYAWDFGDYKNPGGGTSTEEDPKYTYDHPGVYKVILTVTDDDGETAADTLKVTVNNRMPVVELEDDIIVRVYDVVYFNVTATDLDGYITRYEWDFDSDGEDDWFATTKGSTTHFYEMPGKYKATLSVRDDLYDVTVVIRNITVLELMNQPPVADAGRNQTVPVGSVILKGSGFDTDGSIELYEWDFDGDDEYDWSSDETGIVNHSYIIEDTYKAKFRVTDDSGLSASDSVTIIVNNTYIAEKVKAEIYVDWDTYYEYRIVLNNSINSSNLKVIITDIISKQKEVFVEPSLVKVNDYNYSVVSNLKLLPKHSLEIEVFYYGKLIGARSLNIVNETIEYMGPDLDFQAIYDVEQEVEEHDVSGVDIVRITSLGEVKFVHSGSLYHTSMHGTGLYYMYEEFDGGESESEIEATDLWVNITVSGSEIISNSISLKGHGTMTATYEESMVLDMVIKEVRMIHENGEEIENYLYAEGTFSGSMDDPSSGLSVDAEGDVYLTSELLGNGYKKNAIGEEYLCSIQKTNITLNGDTIVGGGLVKTPFSSTMINTTWNTNFEKYENNTIYYEYTSISTVANLDFKDSGSGYPENSPTPRIAEDHIQDALIFETPRPRVLYGEDSIVLESTHGVKLQLQVTGETEKTISGKHFVCSEIEGKFLSGADGFIETCTIRSGSFAGLAVEEAQEIYWKDEWVTGEMSLKSVK